MITGKINKRLCKFEHMDIKDCCLSTSQTILRNTLLPAKICLRFSKGDVWKKNSSDSTSDITMLNYDDVEMFELVSLCILVDHSWPHLYNRKRCDYVGMILRRLNAQHQRNRIRKHIEKIKSFGFKIEIIKNLPEVNFLDVLFKLRASTYCPHR